MNDPSGMSTAGQLEGLGVMATTMTAAVILRARRAKVRQARKLRALRKVSGTTASVGHIPRTGAKHERHDPR